MCDELFLVESAGADPPDGEGTGFIGGEFFTRNLPFHEEDDVLVVEENISCSEIIPRAEPVANPVQIAGGNGAAEIPTPRDEAGAVDAAGVAAGASIAELALGLVCDVTRLFPRSDFCEERLRCIESAPLIGHTPRHDAGLPPAVLVAVFCERFIRGMHCDTGSVHTVADMPLLRQPLYLGVAVSGGERLTRGDFRSAGGEEDGAGND